MATSSKVVGVEGLTHAGLCRRAGEAEMNTDKSRLMGKGQGSKVSLPTCLPSVASDQA